MSSAQTNATSFPSGENAEIPWNPGELVKGSSRGGGPEYPAGEEKWNHPTTARRMIASTAAAPASLIQGRDFGVWAPGSAAVLCAAVRPEVMSRCRRFKSARRSAAL